MEIAYRLLLYVHILSAILSIGPFVVILPIVKKLRTAEGPEQHAYVAVFRSVIRLAKHTGHVLVASGIGLVYTTSTPWTTPWLLTTILILTASLWFLARAFSPKLRVLNEPGQDRGRLVRGLSRSVWVYLALLLIMLGFMVMKPELWAP